MVTTRNGEHMATKEEVINITFSVLIATGHGGEKKLTKRYKINLPISHVTLSRNL